MTLNASLLYIEGAGSPLALNMGGFGATVGYAVTNVADLGPGVLQYIVITWSRAGSCEGGKEYTVAAVDVRAGESVDAGLLQFNGYCNFYNASDLSWRRDGGQVAASVGGAPRKFAAAGEPIGTSLFTSSYYNAQIAWSPVDDRILYRETLSTPGIYLTTNNAGKGVRLVPDSGASPAEYPCWLPDGSGFVFTLGGLICEYDLATGSVITQQVFFNETPQHASLSSNGQFIVFELKGDALPYPRDLWLLQRNAPGAAWPLTQDHASLKPDWSKADPPSSDLEMLAPFAIGPNSLVVRWTSTAGAQYDLYATTGMLAQFSVLFSNIPAYPPVNSHTNLIQSVTQRFYQVRRKP